MVFWCGVAQFSPQRALEKKKFTVASITTKYSEGEAQTHIFRRWSSNTTDSSFERFFTAVCWEEITRGTTEHCQTPAASAFMYVGFHKPLHWDFIFMFKPKPSSCSLLMRGEGHGQRNVQKLEHGREKSEERRQCPKKTTACLSFGDKMLLRAGFHEKQPNMAPGGMCWPWQSHSAWGHSQVLGQLNPLKALGPWAKLGATPHPSGHLRITRSREQSHCPVSPGRVDTPLLTILMSHGEHCVASK